MNERIKMVHDLSTKIEPAIVPSDYQLRVSTPEDLNGILRLFQVSSLGIDSKSEFESRFQSHSSFCYEHIFVIEHKSLLVATASGFTDREDPAIGFLHMVGVDPEHRGKGLGRSVVVAALRHHQSMNMRYQWLLTSPDREAAVCMYLRMGYKPQITNPDDGEIWRSLLDSIKWPLDRWPNELA